MILPLGDSPNPPGSPHVTRALIAVNVAVYVLITLPLGASPVDPSDPLLAEYARTVAERLPGPVTLQQVLAGTSAYDLFLYRYGFRPVAPGLLALFTSMFLHGGFLHLAGNMLFLWIYGDNVEHRLGRGRYLAAYLATGAAATLFHAWFEPASPLPVVGASGAISGVLGLYFVWFPHNRVRLLLFFPLLAVVAVPARILLGLYLIADNLLPFLATRGTEAAGVAYGAHIGGFLGGLAVAWWANRREMTARPREFRPTVAALPGVPPERIRAALAEGRFADAADAYFALSSEATRGVLGPAESLGLAERLGQNGHGRAALVVYRRQLRDHAHGPGAAKAHLGAAIIQLERLGQEASAYQHLLDALECDPSPETETRIREELRRIDTGRQGVIGRRRLRG